MSDQEWFYDLETGKAVQGRQSGWQNRMGPYATETEALAALEKAAQRNEQADSYDED